MVASATGIQRKVERVSALLEERIGLGGSDLRAKVARGRRVLERDLRKAADRLAQAAEMAAHPRLAAQVDEHQVDDDYRLLVRKLEAIPPGSLRRELFRSTVQSALTTVLGLVVLTVGILFWMAGGKV